MEEMSQVIFSSSDSSSNSMAEVIYSSASDHDASFKHLQLAPKPEEDEDIFTPSQRDPLLQVELVDRGLWEEFAAHSTEMVVTKPGRRLFPPLCLKVKGMEPSANYYVIMDIVNVNKNRYRYQNQEWTICGAADPPVSFTYYVHPSSPSTGGRWMKEAISFRKVKITKCPLSLSQDKIVKLKVKHNPFAKGFRESGEKKEKENSSSSVVQVYQMEQKEVPTFPEANMKTCSKLFTESQNNPPPDLNNGFSQQIHSNYYSQELIQTQRGYTQMTSNSATLPPLHMNRPRATPQFFSNAHHVSSYVSFVNPESTPETLHHSPCTKSSCLYRTPISFSNSCGITSNRDHVTSYGSVEKNHTMVLSGGWSQQRLHGNAPLEGHTKVERQDHWQRL